ncbi:hypothetical protein HPB50_016012 [Hyalomma asiaticum]|uniref:Uncharacterized protein n=1 Tax=Hyalomma asiaticum TaxID=266040 RepID=A0ACB7T7Q2_HYAAI|nr:hypothetical protein HPB50_016012 [Hyalomma asiaticum]
MSNAIAVDMSTGVRDSPLLTMKIAVFGVDKAVRDTLCDRLAKLSEWAEFRPCTSNSFESLELLPEAPSIQNNFLCVLILDITSSASCMSVNTWLESLRSQSCSSRVCVVVYNAHKVAEYALPPYYIRNMRKQEPRITFLFHGPDEEKWQSLVAAILRWGEIAAGLRGNVTVQYLRSVLQRPNAYELKANCTVIEK